MRQDQIIYWMFVASAAGSLWLGVWLGFFSGKLLGERARLLEPRLGKKAARFFVVTLRALGVLLIVPSLYLLSGLLRILPCAIK